MKRDLKRSARAKGLRKPLIFSLGGRNSSFSGRNVARFIHKVMKKSWSGLLIIPTVNRGRWAHYRCLHECYNEKGTFQHSTGL